MPKKAEGKWVLKVDIVKRTGNADSPQLALETQDKVGECNEECRTVQQACGKAISGREEDLVSFLKDSAGLSKLQNSICEKPCKQKSLPNLDKWTDQEFKEDKDEAINSLMESMKGMPGMENLKMYKPGDLAGLGKEDLEMVAEERQNETSNELNAFSALVYRSKKDAEKSARLTTKFWMN